jgi:two-component system, LuxR family, sensor kinase FixL
LRLASVFDSAGDPIFVLDDAGIILLFNKACERMFGHSAAQVVGEHVKVLMSPAAAGGLGEDVAAYFRQAEARGEVWFQDRDGKRLPVELCFSTAGAAAETQHLLVLRGRPGADRRLQSQSELMRAARLSAMEEVSAAVTHKLNQPLTALTLYLQAIERVYARETSGGVLPDGVVSILEKSIHETERASSMLQHLRQSLDQGDVAVVTETNGVGQQGEAPNEVPEPPDGQCECGLAASRVSDQDHGGDLVVDSGEGERSTPRPAAPARVSAPPAQEEQGKWVNV